MSKSICALLNSYQGGRVRLGVTDDACVRGILVTYPELEHTILAIVDVLTRYKPKVPEDAVKVFLT